MRRAIAPLTATAIAALLAACATTAPPTDPMQESAAGSIADQDLADLRPALPFETAGGETRAAPAEPAPAAAPPIRRRATTPLSALTLANAEARRTPRSDAFVDAAQIYDYAAGALYEVYAVPGYLSTILLEPGEAIVTVAAGDTTRWMVEETVSGDLAEPRALLLIKPTRAGTRTNIVLATDRRTYLIEAIAVEGSAYSAQTAWRYPADSAHQDRSDISGIALEDLNFRYRIDIVRGPPPRWRPVRVFDDGRRTYVEFPLDIATSEAPPLFLRDGNDVALVNYRIVGNRYVVDRLFEVAELRLGGQRQTIVRISREHARIARRRR